MPDFLIDAPKTLDQAREIRKETPENIKRLRKVEAGRLWKLQYWWLQKMFSEEQVLREKMTLFLHNHFVSSYQKVKLSYLMYEQNQLFRENAFGNFKELTKKVLHNNAMLIYLDNHQNKLKTPNENLGRELLELFTLGIGNYSETDISNAAAALAGLAPGDQGGRYVEKWRNNGMKTLFGKSFPFEVNSLVDEIFLQPAMGKLLAKKLLIHFISDDPDAALINKFHQLLVKENFELKPVLTALLNEPAFLNSQGSKIKDPITFLLSTAQALSINKIPPLVAVSFLRQQQFELFNPPNVKGWDGGRSWLDVQKLIQRNSFCQFACKGEYPLKSLKRNDTTDDPDVMSRAFSPFSPFFFWNKNLRNNKEIIQFVLSQLIFENAEHLKDDMEEIMKYDFDPSLPGADAAVLRLVEYCMQTPDYQIS
jgi:uncharacterized protein (DUF1800 family)